MPAKVKKIKWRCALCGKQKWLRPCDARHKRYCSRDCTDRSLRVERPKHPARWNHSYGIRECLICGNGYDARTPTQMYCTRKCALRNAQKQRMGRSASVRPCESCGKEFKPRSPSATGRFCSRKCTHDGMKGSKHSIWRGGRYITGEGYVKILMPNHPKAHGHGGYVAEHRVVIEKHLGRLLKRSETVHHINGNKSDNRIENLELRVGPHGKGAAMMCGDCGSRNIVPAPKGNIL
jgi:hypothetical protein